MMSRWGLEGMGSFEQKSVARKEGLGAALRGDGTPEAITLN
jgi:biotin synthase